LARPNSRGDRAYVEISGIGRDLKIQTIEEKADAKLVSDASLKGPVRFLNRTTLVYRAGSADYAVSTLGGKPKKIADVAPTTPASGLLFSYN
jgi:hypothetical protein